MGKLKKSYFFEDVPVLGKLPLEERAKKFEEVGDVDTAKNIEAEANAISKGVGLFRREERRCEDTAHALGFIPTNEPGKKDLIHITYAGLIEPDESLERVKITLDALGAADYPGRGVHRILFDFYAKNQLPQKQVEELHFNQTYPVREGQTAGIVGYPIFIGLNVGPNGLDFKCITVNVKNDDDERILNFLDSDVFRTGLTLATTAQPAITPLVNLAVGITKMVAGRNKNVAVQNIAVGLDYTKIATRARLAQGSYVAVQIPQKDVLKWNWEDWVYAPAKGFIVNVNDNEKLIPYNYFVISVSRYEET